MRKNIVALILMSCAILYAQDDGKGPTFLPVDPVENFYSGSGINLEVLIDDQSELGSAFLFYKFEGDLGFSSIEMIQEINTYIASIPDEFVKAGNFEYYFFASDQYGNQSYWPNGGEQNPKIILINQNISNDTNQSRFEAILINPQDQGTIDDKSPTIMISIFDYESSINKDHIQVLLDNNNVTDKSFISSDMITYVPENFLLSGEHVIDIILNDGTVKYFSKKFTFEITEEKLQITELLDQSWRDKIGFQGKATWNAGFDQSENRPDDTQKFSINTKFKLGKFKFLAEGLLNTHFIDEEALSEMSRKQSPNRFKFSVKSPNIYALYGDASPKFSELTLKGARIRGLYAKANYKNFQMIFISGQTKNSIKSIAEWIEPESLTDNNPTLLDSLNTSQIVDYYETYTGNTVIQYDDGSLRIFNSEETVTLNEEASNGDPHYTFYITETFEDCGLNGEFEEECVECPQGICPDNTFGNGVYNFEDGDQYTDLNENEEYDGLPTIIADSECSCSIPSCSDGITEIESECIDSGGIWTLYEIESECIDATGIWTCESQNHYEIISTFIDTTVLDPATAYFLENDKGTLKRVLTGLRAQYKFNNNKGHFGFSALRSKDIPSSLGLDKKYLWETDFYTLLGNAVLGMDLSLKFNQKQTTLYTEYAISAVNDITDNQNILSDTLDISSDQLNNLEQFFSFPVTNDLFSGSSEGRGLSVPMPGGNDQWDEGESYTDSNQNGKWDEGEDYFDNPLYGYDRLDYFFNSFLKRGTYIISFKTPFKIKQFNNEWIDGDYDFNFDFKRAPSNFVSFGNNSVQTDIKSFKTNLKRQFWKDQIALNLGYDFQEDNVDGTSISEKKKTVTTTSKNYSMGLGFSIFGYPTVNYALKIINRLGISIIDGSESVKNATISNNITPSHKFKFNNIDCSANGNIMFMQYNDKINAATNFNTITFAGGLGLTFNSPLSMSMGGGLSINATKNPDDPNTIFNIISNKISYKFFNDKFITTLGINMVRGFKNKNGLWDSGENFIDEPDGDYQNGIDEKIELEGDSCDSGYLLYSDESDSFCYIDNGNGEYDAGEDLDDKYGIKNFKYNAKLDFQFKISKDFNVSLNVSYLNLNDSLNPTNNNSEFRGKIKIKYGF